MNSKSLTIWILVLGWSQVGQATLPPDAQAFLNMIPEKALTLDLVLGRAIASSDNYRALKVQKDAANTVQLRAESSLSTQLTAGLEWQDDRTQPQIIFMPSRTQGTKYSLGASTLFTTGTHVALSLSHGRTELTLSGSPIPPFTETRGALTLSQSLWRNFLGASTKAGLKSAEQQTVANQAAFEQNREEWFLQLGGLYYQAWAAQARVAASRKNLERQERLLKIINIKLKRGTAEAPDRIQVLSAKTNAQLQLEQDEQDLGDLWRTLLTTLKLPEQWASIDPAEIPMKLDAPITQALRECGNKSTLNAEPKTTSAIRIADAMRDSAQFALEKAKSDYQPSLDLGLSLGANRIDPNSAATWDFFNLQYPRYAAGITFRYPIGLTAEKAAHTEAVVNQIRADAMAQQARDMGKVDWANGCLTLQRLQRSRDWLAVVAENQHKREELEEERFQIGRAGTLQVIMAGGDATQAEQMLNLAQTQVRLAAWKVLRLTGALNKYLDNLERSENK